MKKESAKTVKSNTEKKPSKRTSIADVRKQEHVIDQEIQEDAQVSQECACLPPSLQKRHLHIIEQFNCIATSWTAYPEGFIPEDPAFARMIIQFLIDVVTYVHDCFFDVDLKTVASLQSFLAFYEYDFFYGPSGNEHNYLAFEEKADEVAANEICWELMDKDYPLDKDKLLAIKDQYALILSQLHARSS